MKHFNHMIFNLIYIYILIVNHI